MKKQNIPEEIFSLITEEEINLFQELQIKIKELNNKTNLTRLTAVSYTHLTLPTIVCV